MSKKKECTEFVFNSFKWLSAVFTIIIIIGLGLVGITIGNIYLIVMVGTKQLIFSDLTPPFTGISGGILFIAGLIGIVHTKKIRHAVCDNGVNIELL